MPTSVNNANTCPNCGHRLPAGVLAGLCPACLMAQGAATDADERSGHAAFTPPPVETMARLFPQLEILGLIGAGGMGAVYQARQPALDRVVALKVLPAGGAEVANFAERFNREARALARLNHPNIVAVYEFGHVEGLHYFLMEHVDGANLRQLEQTARLAPREALQLIPQICDALQYAHDEGVVHRDIKPENVLVDRKGRVKIADFGLAKILGRDSETLRLTNDGQVMGTPHYMAPEQVARPLSVDHRADIYSLGVVLYEMLTGELPIGNFPPPSRKVQVDIRFDEVVLRALENDPERRFQHASEVKTRVENIAGGAALAAAPPANAAGATEQRENQLYWAGFPVAKASGNRRTINWIGTLGAAMLAFAFLVLGIYLVRKLFGITIPSLVIPAQVAILVVVLGVRRTLNQPVPAELPRTTQGTVILPPRHWWHSSWLPFLSIPVFAMAWALLQSHWFPPRTLGSFDKTPILPTAPLIPSSDSKESAGGKLPRQVGSLRLIGGMNTNNLVLARTESLVGFPLHEVVVRFAGPAITPEQWQWPRSFAWGPTLAPNPNENLGTGWQPAPVYSQDIWGGTADQPKSSCWYACPNECQLQFALADATEAAEAVRQIKKIFTQPVALAFNTRIELFRVGEKVAWLETRPVTAPAGKLAFLTRHGRSPLNPYSTNQVDSAVIAMPPNATLTITGNGYYNDRSNGNMLRRTNGIFSTTLSSQPDRPGTYWITWMRGSPANPSGDGWEIYLHDAETAKELKHFQSAEKPGTIWSTDWGQESKNANAGETMQIALLKAYEGSSSKGLINSLIEVEMTMRPSSPMSGEASNSPDVASPGQLTEPPQLRFLTWQDEWDARKPQGAWHPDGTPVTAVDELALLENIDPARQGLSAALAATHNPRFLQLWISHPLLRNESFASLSVYDTDGRPARLELHNSMASTTRFPGLKTGSLGWYLVNFSPGEPGSIPALINLQLDYTIGPLEHLQEVRSDFNGAMALEGGSQLNGIGQNAAGKSFISLAVDAQKMKDRRFTVRAVTREGNELPSRGGSYGGNLGKGVRVESFEFELPLDRISRFKIGTRPLRNVAWKNVPLPIPGPQ